MGTSEDIQKEEDEEEEKQPGSISWLIDGNSAARFLDFLVEQREFDYSEADIAEAVGVSAKTIYREIPRLESLGLLLHTRKVGRAKMYRLNMNSKIAPLLVKLAYEIGSVRIENILKEQKAKQPEGQKFSVLERPLRR
ncbi:MAG: HTH domain-containing protein [Nitrososphaeraceae archaeon]|nr:HTH domain-containing protein [Nitrososphaeraceae archaeon]